MVTQGEAAGDGVGLGGDEPIHRITVTATSFASGFISQIALNTMASVRRAQNFWISGR
jgi:hypothetical protein